MDQINSSSHVNQGNDSDDDEDYYYQNNKHDTVYDNQIIDINQGDDYGGEFEPQEATWTESDTFPNDDALVLHFVNKYPDIEDLEDTITDDILGEDYEYIKKKAASNLKKQAKNLGVPPDVLQEIIDAKESMGGIGGKANEQGLPSQQKNNESTSFFDKDDDTRQNFNFLKELLKPDRTITNYQELENLLKANDPTTRFIILRNFKNRKHSMIILEKLETFARLNNLPQTLFKYVNVYDTYKTNADKIDEAVHLMYQRFSLEEISQTTGIDLYTLHQLKNCARIYGEPRERRTNFDFVAADFVDEFSQGLYMIYSDDTTRRIGAFNDQLKTALGAFDYKPIALQEFRTVTLMKKEDLEEPLMNCRSFGEAVQVLKPLILSYIQCSLPLEEIVKYYQMKFQPAKGQKSVKATAQDFFDAILFNSAEDVKALILERYSNIYPVPMLISDYEAKAAHLFYHCAYFIQPCKTILSFGILRASWTRCGKSALIDELFSTDFTCNHKGNFDARTGSQSSYHSAKNSRNVYDVGRIDIQMPRNIDSYEPETQWQFLDASRFCDPNILDLFCWKINVIMIHVLALDMVNTPLAQLTSIFRSYQKYQKKIMVFIRDIDELKPAQLETLAQALDSLQKGNASQNLHFVQIQSILMKEQNRMNDFQSTDGQTFEVCLDRAIYSLKKNVIKFNLNEKQMFDSRAVVLTHSQLYGIDMSSGDNALKQDISQVQKIVDCINQELVKQLKEVELQHQQLEHEKDDPEGARRAAASRQAAKGGMSEDSPEDQIRSSLISDKVLFYFSKYTKYQKYQSEVNQIIYDSEYQNQANIQFTEKLEQNQQKSIVIQDRSVKMRRIFDQLLPFQRSEAHDLFVSCLKSDRSLLLVWLLTERLHHESSNNPLWKRFLLNQEIFEKNISEGTTQYSPTLNPLDMKQILNKHSSSDFDNEYQLSVFDFFREMILSQFYSANQMQQSLANAKNKVAITAADRVAQTKQMSAIYQNKSFMLKLRQGFSKYAHSGESFELIDGENIRIHDMELSSLLEDYVSELKRQARGKEIRLFVVAQIGKQSVGKSFLFNHMFKTKFLNRSGRCTQGINMAFRELRSSLVDEGHFAMADKLLILDTEGLGSLDKVKRLKGKDINFDRCMVLFCLTVANALIITLKTEIDNETADLLSVCCWALQNLKINKMSPPHIFFVLNQQADTNINNYMRSLNTCIEQISENPLYNKEKISQYIHISTDNFIVLPTAFNQDKRNYENLYDYPVQRSVIKSQFTEKCQNLGTQIIKTIQKDINNKLSNFEDFMKVAGDSFRTITAFPELLRFKNVNEYLCNKTLRDKVTELISHSQIVTSDYSKINHQIITNLHQMDLKLIKKTEEFAQDLLLPLDERYHEYFQQLKEQYQQFSQAKQFQNFPEIVELNLQILSKQCIKQFQYFKNIIIDLINQRNYQKTQKSLEDKVNELIRRKTDYFIQLEKTKWKRDFDLIWEDAEKQVYKGEAKRQSSNSLESFQMLLKDQYTLFSLDCMDNHRMPLTKIFERYISRFIMELGEKEEAKQQVQTGADKEVTIEKIEVVSDIIRQLLQDIKDAFQGKKRSVMNAHESQLVFFEANTSKIPPGKIEHIEGKSQAQPRFINLNSLTDTLEVEGGYRSSKVGRDNDNNWETVPTTKLPESVHPLIQKLMGKSEDQIIKNTSYESQAVQLSQNLPSLRVLDANLWDEVMEDLMVDLQSAIYERQGSIGMPADVGKMSKLDQLGQSYNNFRSQDSKNFRHTIAAVQSFIQELDFELAYIWVNLNSQARIHLNTLAFFVCFQNRIIRDEQKLQQEEMVRLQNRKKFYEDFEQNMIEKQKFKLEGLTDDEMKNHDDVKSLYIAQNLINTIENESRDFTYNFIVSQIQTNGGSDLSNRSLVQQINRRVKQRVSGDGVQDAKTDEDPGVKYIVDYHGLIEETFSEKWSKVEQGAFVEAKRRYKEETEISLSQIQNAFNYLLAEMRSLLRKFPEINDKILLDKITVEECFKTNDLFKIYELDDKFGNIAGAGNQTLNSSRQATTTKHDSSVGEFDFSMSMDYDEEADNSADMTSTKKKRKTKKGHDLDQLPAESFYQDLRQFEDESDVSVEDVALEDGEAEGEEGKTGEFQSYLKAKLNLDVFRIPILYLKWYFDASHSGLIQIQEKTVPQLDKKVRVIEFSEQKYQLQKEYTYPLFGRSKDQADEEFPVLSDAIFKKVKQAGLFESSKIEIYNLYRFMSSLVDNLQKAEMSLKYEEFQEMIHPLKRDLEQKSKGCQERCPACNKYCEEAFNHMVEEGIESSHTCSQYGHQFFSMGGRMWADESKECILVQCHDKRLNDFQAIKKLSGAKEKWIEFKNRHHGWMWDDGELADSEYGIDFMIALHNACGNQTFNYYKRKNPLVDIKFRKYKIEDSYSMRGLSKSKQICFVIDGTNSMSGDIRKVKTALTNIAKMEVHKEISIIIYRDHDYPTLYPTMPNKGKLLDQFPQEGGFSSAMDQCLLFLDQINPSAQKGNTPNEAALDGLAAAADLDWGKHEEKDLLVIHIFDAQPHGNWPNYKEHHSESGTDALFCCCCGHTNGVCDKDWDRDVFEKFRAKRLQYHSIFTHQKDYKKLFAKAKRYNEGFEMVMKEQLGNDLCPDTSFTIEEKQLIHIKINDIMMQERQ